MYCQHYGLRSNPFQLTPDPRFLYPSAGHKRAFAYLKYGITRREGFIVITGAIGSGKTLLIQKLFMDLSDPSLVSLKIAAGNIRAEEVIWTVARSFGLDVDGHDKVSIYRKLERYFADLETQGRRVLLVLDEAQMLSWEAMEELRIISNMEIGGKSVIQVFLIGQDDLLERIRSRNMEQLKQRVIAMYHLSGLTKDEVKSYVEHRLDSVGWNGFPIVKDAVYENVFKYTEGIPRRVNVLFDRIFLLGYLEGAAELGAEHVEAIVRELAEEEGANSRRNVDDSSDLVTRVERLERKVCTLELFAERTGYSSYE